VIDPRRRILQGAPAPADAERRLDRIVEVLEPTGVGLDALSDVQIQTLADACARAPYLATLLARDPGRLARVTEDPYRDREKNREQMAEELAEITGPVAADEPEELAAALRRYRGDEIVRLGIRELRTGVRREVGRELAALADVAFDAAIAFHDRALRQRYGPPRFTDEAGVERDAGLAVIGMGKLGGEELNFSSDVDVIYVYSSDNGAAGDATLHKYFSELSRRVSAAIGEQTDDDFVFRVDLRLRPEGTKGAIANSLPSTERYYETWGRPWERQAWLKARPCAGDAALGDEVMRTLEPFIHRRSVSPSVIDEVTELNRKIKAELDSSGVDAGFDVKNGIGGIREVEFFVQALQLVHAGRRPALRVRTTLAALDQLVFAGIITSAEQEILARAYRFLRHVEHMLQLESGRQTQRLPASSDAVDVLARRMGYDSGPAFLLELGEHTDAVAELFSTLGEPDDPLPPAVRTLLSRHATTERLEAAFSQLGFHDPARAVSLLGYAREKPASPFGPAATGAAARVAPELLREIAESPDPDQALGFVVDLVSKRGSWSGIWRLCNENPAVLRLVASLFGTSAYLSRTFVNRPEVIDELVGAGRAHSRWTGEEVRRNIERRFAAIDPDDEELHWTQLAELKQNHTLRIGLADIAGALAPEDVTAELSCLADEVLRAAFDLVHQSMVRRSGRPIDRDTGEAARLAVFGLGKLGGRELGYASDLDIVFVFSGAGHTDGRRQLDNGVFMTRLAQRLVSSLHALHPGGRLYETDTRLRPEGSKGLLVSSVEGWRRYHERSARLWERQALVKLRAVAGDRELGERIERMVGEHLYGDRPGVGGRPSKEELRRHVRDMRDRIEREVAGRELDVKAGRGGINDIEFAAQYLRLLHGWQHPGVRATGTCAALEYARDHELAAPDLCERLLEGYRFLRKLELRIRIVHDRSERRLPQRADEREHLARRMNFANAHELLDYFERTRATVRAAYDAVVPDG